jgi:hypothetical protein
MNAPQQYKVVTHDGWEIKPGDRIRDFRNEDWVYVGCTHPRKLTAKLPDKMDSAHVREFYPNVFNLKIVEDSK